MTNCRHTVRATLAACFFVGATANHCASTRQIPFEDLDGGSGSRAGGDDAATASRDGAGAPPIDLDARDDCRRIGCARPGVTYCGTIGDGCGGALASSDCPNGGICRGGEVEHVCAPTDCIRGSGTAGNFAVL